MKYKFTLFIFFFAFFNSYAQINYAITNDKKIYQVNSDFTMTYICTAGPTPFLINDIAVAPSGAVYGIAYNSLFQINLANGAATFITEFPPNFYVSLVCSSESELYMINNLQKTLYKYNLSTNVLTNVAYLGFETSGDLAFYKGHLIFQTYNSGGSIYMVKAFDLQTGNLVDIMCQPFYFQLWGMVNYGGCDSDIVLAVNPANEFLEINFDSQTYTTTPFVLPEGQTIYGLASSNESLGSLCPVQMLSDLDCELSVKDYSKNTFAVFPNPAANELSIIADFVISEVQVFNSVGELVIKLNGNDITTINVSHLSKGFYLMKIMNSDTTLSSKFLKN